MSKPIFMHGYIEEVGRNDFFAIFLTVNICSRGRSMEEAESNLLEALCLYLESVKGEKESRWIPRRAPFYHYWRYFSIWLRTRLRIFLPDYDAQLMARIVHA